MSPRWANDAAVEQTLSHPIDFDAPWRKATVLIGALAAVELVMLVLLAGALLAKPTVEGATGKKAVAAKKSQTPAKKTAVVNSTPAPAEPAQQPRRKVSVLVLNGNGVQGAAAAYASRVDRKGYKIGGVGERPDDRLHPNARHVPPRFRG